MKNLELFLAFKKAIKYYEKILKKTCNKHNLSQIELNVISFLFNNSDKDTASDIVEFRMLQKGNVSKAIELLVSKNLLEKEIDTLDKRKIHLTLTKNSKKITDDIVKSNEIFFKDIFQGFSSEELKNYLNLNNKIIENINYIIERNEVN